MTEQVKYPKTILIIDDDQRFLKLFTRFLSSDNLYNLITESHSSNVLHMARKHKPDLVLLDLVMPERGGEVLINDFRNDPVLSDINVIFLTGMLGSTETQNRIKKIASRYFMAKSTPREIILKLIRDEVYGPDFIRPQTDTDTDTVFGD